MITRQPPYQRLSLSLLKEGTARLAALRKPDDVFKYRVPAIADGVDSFFTAARAPLAAGWRSYVEHHVDGPVDELLTASASGVLMIPAGDRLMAATFGQGRHLLEPDAVEQDFGLKVVLNCVAPDQLKSVDAKTIDENTLHTRRDASRDSRLSTFGLDLSTDMLRAVTGSPEDETFGKRLTGVDSLSIQTRAQVPELPALAERLLAAFRSNRYRQHFDFIDHLRVEKNTEGLAALESQLLKNLETRNLHDVHLAAPEVLDWLEIDGFRFSRRGRGHEELLHDPKISAYLDRRAGEAKTVELLKRDKLFAIRANDDEVMRGWTIWRCLVFQTEYDGHLFVLSDGQWFRVDLAYRERVYADVNALPTFDGLPSADPGRDEEAYNLKVASHLGGACMDRRLVYDDGPDSMEVCDVLTPAGGLIHVKMRGSSSTLSHLFSQGVNSAERLLQDADFRQRMRAVVEEIDPALTALIPDGRPDPADHEITFVVITRSIRETPLTLPFFSVISLRAAARTLENFGFRVSVAAVREGEEASAS